MKMPMRKVLILFILLLAGLSFFVVPRMTHFQGMPGAGIKKAGGLYYCPMHPTYTSNRPGDCKICSMKLVKRETAVRKDRKVLYYRHPMGQPDISPVPKKDSMGMDYIPVYEDEAEGDMASDVPGHAAVKIPPAKQQLIGVKLEKVERRQISKQIRTVGRVAYDPELFTAQQEFISALESLKKAGGGPYHEPLERTKALVESVRVRLKLLGMSDEQITDLEHRAVQDRNLILPGGAKDIKSDPFATLQGRQKARRSGVIPSPDAGGGEEAGKNLAARATKKSYDALTGLVWVYGTIYEHEIPFVTVGSQVRVSLPSFPDKEFTGTVSALDPVLDAATRSIRLRARLENEEGLLKPGMFVDISIETDLGAALVISQEAVMFTGERTLVFAAQDGGIFQPREVKLGAKAGDFYEVKSGLGEGEKIVTSGNFLIDSESRLNAALQGMSGGEHQHGQ